MTSETHSGSGQIPMPAPTHTSDTAVAHHIAELGLTGSAEPAHIAVIVPHDMALDNELWRWSPPEAVLHFTRVRYIPMPVTVESVERMADQSHVRQCVQDLSTIEPQVYAYACTSGSFTKGVRGERRLAEGIAEAGVVSSSTTPSSVTTSGALLEALEHLGVGSISVATPYDQAITSRLVDYLQEAGVGVVDSKFLDLDAAMWRVGYQRTAQLIADADSPEAEAVFVSCTNLATYDIIAPVETMLGKPVITANQVTMWAALRKIGMHAIGPGQRLIQEAAKS